MLISSSTGIESPSSLDSISTGWNACSLEVLSQLNTDENYIDSPLIVIGCYQLIENPLNGLHEGKVVEKITGANVKQDDIEKEQQQQQQQQRMGQLQIYSIKSSTLRKNMCSFGSTPQITTLRDGGGVLDMKWLPKAVSLGGKRALNCTQPGNRRILASALSSGSIRLYSLENGGDVTHDRHHHLRCIASSSLPQNLSAQNLCLSLDWEYQQESEEMFNPSSTQIVSSYSNGQVAVHTAKWKDFSNYKTSCSQTRSEEGTAECTLEETLRFDAHTLFREPSEVWTCCWCRCTSGTVTILSGADDCNLKGWDTRVSTQRPVFCIREHEAGVTALSWHPREQYIFASGSYDEGVRIWDIRVVSNNGQRPPRPMAKLNSCGGGIWRLKWHPRDSTKLLVAAMHGGCHVLHIQALHEDETQRKSNPHDTHVSIVSSFTEHKSMAYGADWFPATCFAHDKNSELRYLAASCSFYDQKAFLWDPFSNP